MSTPPPFRVGEHVVTTCPINWDGYRADPPGDIQQGEAGVIRNVFPINGHDRLQVQFGGHGDGPRVALVQPQLVRHVEELIDA